MKCYICDKEDWHSLGDINKERELRICKSCGNIAYKVDDKEEERVKNYYRYEYRPEPSEINIITTTHKLHYIKIFTKEYFKGKKDLVCGDVGCATGYIPHWLRGLGHRATGSEYTTTFRRFSEHFYGVPISEELQTKHKYDFISIYHVLEHMVKPDEKLKHYVSLLKDDGRILIATPQWLNTLEEASGMPIGSFTNLFHKDHINVFTERSIQNLFNKCGLTIEKEDHIQYGQTYLLKKSNGNMLSVKYEDWKEQEQKILKCKEAIQLFLDRKFGDAVRIWPKFPEAWMRLIFDTHGKVPAMQKELIGKARKHLPENGRFRLGIAMFYYQHQEYEEALKEYEWQLQYRPGEDLMMFLGWTYYFLKRIKDAMRCFTLAAQMNPIKWAEATRWICKCACSMPTWDEIAIEKLKGSVEQKAKASIHMNDPNFDGFDSTKPNIKPKYEVKNP